MEILRNVRGVELNKGNGMSDGLYNLSEGENLSFWFEEETKDRLMKLNDAEYWHQAKELIKESNIDN